MKFWRGSVHLLTSGEQRQLSLAFQQLPRDARSVLEIFRRLNDVHTVYRGRVWVASLEEQERPISEDWFTFWLGHYRDKDQPTWRGHRKGWGLEPRRLEHARQGFFHMPSQTLFMQQIPEVDNPRVAFEMLERLLNRGIWAHYRDTAWVIEVLPDVEAIDFLRKLRDAIQVVRFRVHMPVPNARSHDILKQLQGMGGAAHADHVDVTVHAKKGSIEKRSAFVTAACRLVAQGIALAKAWVFYEPKKTKKQKPALLSSEELSVVREFDVPDLSELPRGQAAPRTTPKILEEQVGLLTDESEVIDVEEFLKPLPPPPPPRARKRRNPE